MPEPDSKEEQKRKAKEAREAVNNKIMEDEAAVALVQAAGYSSQQKREKNKDKQGR